MVRLMSLTATALALGALGIAAGCSGDSTDPGQLPADSINIAPIALTAPPLAQTEVTFWAVVGQDRTGRICYLGADSIGTGGDTCDEEFVRLDVNAQSLYSLPNGTRLHTGDSVQITMRVVDPTKALVEFLPTGLKFSATEPAELKIRYSFLDDDINEDGEVNESDSLLVQQLAIWRQETPGAAFTRLTTLRVEQDGEYEAKLTGFSRYAIAY
jgi:hypothetical protein